MRWTLSAVRLLSWISVASLLAAAAIGGWAIYAGDKTVLDAATFLVLLSGTLVAFSQLKLFGFQLANENERQRRERSISYSLIHHPHLRHARTHLEKFFAEELRNVKPVSASDLGVDEEGAAARPGYNRMMLIHLLNHWENLALTVYAKATDEDVAFEMVGSLLVEHTIVFKHFIEHQLNEQPRSYNYIIHLAAQWQERLQKRPPPLFVPQERRLSVTAMQDALRKLCKT